MKAYASPDSIYVTGNKMYIAGSHTLEDWVDDVGLPFGAESTTRYHQALKRWTPNIKTVIGHSLGGAIAAAMTEGNANIKARTYAAPLFRISDNPRVESYRHYLDPVSMFDRHAHMTLPTSFNPHSYTGY